MRSHLHAATWRLLAVIVIAVPVSARAQSLDVDVAGAAPPGQTQRFIAELPFIAELKGDDGGSDGLRANSHHDRLFQSLSAAFVIAAGTDVSVSMYQIGRGVARERAFGAPWQDSPVAFAVTKSAMTAAFVYGLQRIHKDRPKTAFVLGVAATALEGWLAVRSARISPQP